LLTAGLLLVAGGPFGALSAQESPKLDQSVAKGLSALVKLQAENGSFGSNQGVTALVGMALLAGGHTPSSGQYRKASAQVLKYLLSSQDAMSGYLGSAGGNMYAHGFSTLYLAECYGMSPEPRLRRALEAALELTFRAQNDQGGWRYQPAPVDADISVTITQIMAIRAAYNVGIGGERAQQVIAKAMSYVRSLVTVHGTFMYRHGNGIGGKGPGWVPRTAAGTMSILGSGLNDLSDPVLGPAMKFLRELYPDHLQGTSHHYWYGQYYTAQAMFHSPDEKDWNNYWKIAEPTLIEFQGEDGLWVRSSSYGPAYATSIALIILQIPNNYLPIFQH
jgi:hypothetical protein